MYNSDLTPSPGRGRVWTGRKMKTFNLECKMKRIWLELGFLKFSFTAVEVVESGEAVSPLTLTLTLKWTHFTKFAEMKASGTDCGSPTERVSIVDKVGDILETKKAIRDPPVAKWPDYIYPTLGFYRYCGDGLGGCHWGKNRIIWKLVGKTLDWAVIRRPKQKMYIQSLQCAYFMIVIFLQNYFNKL